MSSPFRVTASICPACRNREPYCDSGGQESLGIAGLLPSWGALTLFLWESPWLGESPPVPAPSLPALVKMPGPEVAGWLKGKSSQHRQGHPSSWQQQFFRTWLPRFSRFPALPPLGTLALRLGPQGLQSPRGTGSLSTLHWVAHRMDKCTRHGERP